MTTPYTHLHDAALSLDAAARAMQLQLNQSIYRNVPDGRVAPIVAIAQRLGTIRHLAIAVHTIADSLVCAEPTLPPVPAARLIPPNRPPVGDSSRDCAAGGGS